MKLIDVRQWCRETFHYYVVFTKSIFFILGLILSYKLVEKTFLDILITHLTAAWEGYDLRRAVIIINFQEGLSAVSVILFAYAADVYTGRFKMVVFSTGICILGLLLNFLADAGGDDKLLEFGLFYPALVLMTLAQSALTVTLRVFLDDQLRPRVPTAVTNDIARRQRRRSSFWWTFLSIVAAIFAIFGPLARLEFWKLAIVLTSVMDASFIIFLLGTKCYNRADRIPNPFKDVEIVISRAIANRKLEYPQSPDGSDLHIAPRVSWLRWLDKAAIVRGPGRGSPASVEQVRRAKLMLEMLPLWSCFLTFSLVDACGSTFFYEEAISLADKDIRPILVFAQISNYVLKKLREREQYKEQKMKLVRIGIGISCSVACCIAAWATTARMRRQSGGDKMSVYWLTPQYLLLGVMRGLSADGLQSFYESQVSESLARFGPPLGEFVMGVGKFMSILWILILSRGRHKWFHNDLAHSRLDWYYILLASLNFVNLIIYCLVGYWYRDDVFLVEEEADDEEMGTAHLQADQLVEDALASRSIIESQHISHRYLSLQNRTVSKPKESSSSTTITTQGSTSRKEVEIAEDQLLASESTKNSILTIKGTTAHHQVDQLVEDGLECPSIIEGQHISHHSLSHRTVSKPEESSSGDVITESSRQEVETPEVLLLPSESIKNSISKLRAVTAFLSLFSKATHRPSESTPLKDE